ncbi:septation protein SepH [Arthrobacter sp. ATA002]|uniref:septation protein SepH n=1 Tax=Arthrobacter sp. ATA002 TaxID=2991715 RepID=UPI002E314D2F|nr:septation protein SepH [Arthrobacter sp. ATA002]
MVNHRLKAFGVDPDGVEWDAWRRPDSTWDVVARFDLGSDSQVSVGEEPPARWTFSPLRKSVANANRWAQLLSELEPLDSPVPSRRLTAVADRVFDFEAVAPPEADGAEAGDEDTDNLLEVLRSRRGQRLGADEDGDDALAALLAKGSIPAAHPRDGHTELDDSASPRPRTGRVSLAPAATDSADAPDAPDSLRLTDGVSPGTREISVLARPFRRRGDAAATPGRGTSEEDTAGGDAASAPAAEEPGAAASGPQAPAAKAGVESPTTTEAAVVNDPPAVPDSASPAAGRSKAKTAGRKGGRTDFPWDRMSSGSPRNDVTGSDSTPKGEDPADKRTIKPKRSSVPSWDEIVFGTKGD